MSIYYPQFADKLFDKYNIKNTIRLRFKHFIYVIFTLIVMILISGTLKKTDELQFKMINIFILLKSVVTGSSPSIFSFWLFISNLIISPQFILNRFISYPILNNISVLLPISGFITFLFLLYKKKYSLALISTTIFTFPFIVNISVPYLINWDRNWIISVKYGGTLFLQFTVILFYMWNKNKKLAELGFLGILILISNIFFAWMLAPIYFVDAQSAFDFSIRYYTLPSVGMALIFGSIFSYFLEYFITLIKTLFNRKRKNIFIIIIKNITVFPVYLAPITIILYSLTLNALTTRSVFIEKNNNLNEKNIDKLWYSLLSENINYKDKKSDKIIYIENFGTIKERDYIKSTFPIRFSLIVGDVANPSNYYFVYNIKDLKETYLKEINENYQIDFYAFEYKENTLLNITDKIDTKTFIK